VKNAIQASETLAELHAVTEHANSRESIKNAVPPQELATNSLDAREVPLLDSADLLHSSDQMPDASSLEPPRVNVTEAVPANKRRVVE